MPHKNIDGKTLFFRSKLLGVALMISIVGTVVTLASQAASSSTISGYAFKDINRNGVMDAGDIPLANQGIYILNETNTFTVKYVVTDNTGYYTATGLGDGIYNVEYENQAWWSMRAYWTPTTTGSILPKKNVSLTGQATANFGFREVVRSYDVSVPVSSYVATNGLKVNSYDDVVPAVEIYNTLMQGTLFGKEAPLTTISFDYPVVPNSVTGIRDYDNNQPNFTSIGANGEQGYWSNYTADSRLAYVSWVDSKDNLMFHEYGHAWSNYYAYIVMQNTNFTDYLKIRGIENDSRLYSGHAWTPSEMIAEDYRQLFGSPNAQSFAQENREIPRATDVPGLREYLSGAFMQSGVVTPPPPPTDTLAPTAPTNLVGQSVSTSEGISINLSWQASTDNIGVEKYLIYRNGVQINSVNSPGTKFVDTSIAPNSSYQYYLKAVDAAGNVSVTSPTITVATAPPDTQSPTTPSGLTSPTQTQTSIALKWNPSTDNVAVTGYRVYQIGGTRKNSFNTLVATTTGTGTTYTVTGLTRGTSYSYYVVATDGAGNTSAPSTTLTVKTKR